MTDLASNSDGGTGGLKRRAPKGARVFGDLVAIAVNLVILWILSNLLEWGWLSFLTDDFADVLPLIRLQILTTVGVHLFLILQDPEWLRAAGDVITASVGLAAVIALWLVFPFDFGSGAGAGMARFIIGVGIAGTIVSIPVNLAKVIRRLPR